MNKSAFVFSCRILGIKVETKEGYVLAQLILVIHKTLINKHLCQSHLNDSKYNLPNYICLEMEPFEINRNFEKSKEFELSTV